MRLEKRARELVDHLQTVLWEVRRAGQSNPEVCKLLTPQEMRAVLTLGRRGPRAMSELADALQLSLSSATGIVDQLDEKGLARRERSADDRRVVRVALTPAGREAHSLALECHAEFARGLLKSLDPAEQEALLELFRKIAARLGAAAQAV